MQKEEGHSPPTEAIVKNMRAHKFEKNTEQ